MEIKQLEELLDKYKNEITPTIQARYVSHYNLEIIPCHNNYIAYILIFN